MALTVQHENYWVLILKEISFLNILCLLMFWWDWSYDFESVYRFTYPEKDGENTLVFIPYRDKKRFRISTTVPESILGTIDEMPSIELFQSLVDQAVPVATNLSNLRWSSKYRISHRIVDRYSDGRVFLTGDAAHIHPPIGGQGMNTGFQDAYNLGWKLAMVLKSYSKVDLLDSYHEEYPIGLEVVNRTHQRLLEAKKDKFDVARQSLLLDSQVLVNYRQSSLTHFSSEDGSLQPGDRADDVPGLRMEGLAYDLRLFQLLRRSTFKLLVYLDQNPGEELLLSLEQLDRRYPYLQCLVIANNSIQRPDACLLTWIKDNQERIKRTGLPVQIKCG